MDEVDNSKLVLIILQNVYKYDEEGRRTCLTAEEVVAYATTLSNFICGEDEEANDVEH